MKTVGAVIFEDITAPTKKVTRLGMGKFYCKLTNIHIVSIFCFPHRLRSKTRLTSRRVSS